MARGWESKAVEEQQADAANITQSAKPRMSAEQIVQQKTRNGLELSRQRVLQQLQIACNSNHRKMLQKALADLDLRIAALD